MKKLQPTPVKIHLECGVTFNGSGLGDFSSLRGGEFVFCTAMTGIEESLTDPSFMGQVLVTTVAHVGNTGYTVEDGESSRIQAEGLICRHLETEPSNWRAKKSLGEWLVEQGRFVVDGIDTREFTMLLRDRGSQRGVVVPLDENTSEPDMACIPDMNGRDLATLAGCKESYFAAAMNPEEYWPIKRELPRNIHGVQKTFNVAVWDFGVKQNTLRLLQELGAFVTVLPPTAKADELLAAGKDGILLSNGPGDPSACSFIIRELRALLGRKPLFAICLGHQLVGLAMGAKTYKMKFGHRGIHHPVMELDQNGKQLRTWITSQNHGFAVDRDSLPDGARVSFVHADDGSVEGLSVPKFRCETVQFHPEAAPGPVESSILLARFMERMNEESSSLQA